MLPAIGWGLGQIVIAEGSVEVGVVVFIVAESPVEIDAVVPVVSEETLDTPGGGGIVSIEDEEETLDSVLDPEVGVLPAGGVGQMVIAEVSVTTDTSVSVGVDETLVSAPVSVLVSIGTDEADPVGKTGVNVVSVGTETTLEPVGGAGVSAGVGSGTTPDPAEDGVVAYDEIDVAHTPSAVTVTVTVTIEGVELGVEPPDSAPEVPDAVSPTAAVEDVPYPMLEELELPAGCVPWAGGKMVVAEAAPEPPAPPVPAVKAADEAEAVDVAEVVRVLPFPAPLPEPGV